MWKSVGGVGLEDAGEKASPQAASFFARFVCERPTGSSDHQCWQLPRHGPDRKRLAVGAFAVWRRIATSIRTAAWGRVAVVFMSKAAKHRRTPQAFGHTVAGSSTMLTWRPGKRASYCVRSSAITSPIAHGRSRGSTGSSDSWPSSQIGNRVHRAFLLRMRTAPIARRCMKGTGLESLYRIVYECQLYEVRGIGPDFGHTSTKNVNMPLLACPAVRRMSDVSALPQSFHGRRRTTMVTLRRHALLDKPAATPGMHERRLRFMPLTSTDKTVECQPA